MVTVRPDGSMDVVETRTFSFSGDFTWITQDLALAGCQGIEGISVSEGGKRYAQVEGFGDARDGTYSLMAMDDKVSVIWRFSASDQERTIDLTYTVRGAVLVHRDVAEVYWKFVGDGWDIPSDQVNVVLNLPSGAGLDEIKAWGHGPGRQHPIGQVAGVPEVPPGRINLKPFADAASAGDGAWPAGGWAWMRASGPGGSPAEVSRVAVGVEEAEGASRAAQREGGLCLADAADKAVPSTIQDAGVSA